MQTLRALAVIVTLVAGSIADVAQAPWAGAETCTHTQTVGTQTITVTVECPGNGGQQTDAGNTGSSGGVPAICHDVYSGKEVPCTDPNSGGVYFPDAQVLGGVGCDNGFMLSPQPPAGSAMWEGHDASEGSVWGCDTDFVTNENTFFVPNSQAPTIVDPAVLAERALGQMRLVAADARIAPGPSFHTYININNWLWVPAGQWHSMDLSVSAGPTTVTVTAAPVRVDWDMGNGDTKQCFDAGRASEPGMTDAAMTTCSYAYTSLEDPAGDTHTVSAQLVYAVTWTCAGTCLTPSGDMGEVVSPAGQSTSIEVRQRQTVVTQ